MHRKGNLSYIYFNSKNPINLRIEIHNRDPKHMSKDNYEDNERSRNRRNKWIEHVSKYLYLLGIHIITQILMLHFH